MVQIFDREILTDFLVIHQNFSYQIFLLAKANVVLVTVFYQCFICPHQKFVPYSILNSFIKLCALTSGMQN